MQYVYGVCAAIGGSILVVQFVLTMMGLGDDAGGDLDVDVDIPDDVDIAGDVDGMDVDAAHDLDRPGEMPDDLPGRDLGEPGHGSTWFFGVLTFRTVVAALAFFGLAGLAGQAAQLTPLKTLVVAVAAGLAAMYSIHWLMQMFYRLRDEGTVRINQALGKTAAVYIPIPGGHSGAGKIQLNMQERVMEYDALTKGDALPTGARVRVVRVAGPDTLEVEPVATGDTHDDA